MECKRNVLLTAVKLHRRSAPESSEVAGKACSSTNPMLSIPCGFRETPLISAPSPVTCDCCTLIDSPDSCISAPSTAVSWLLKKKTTMWHHTSVAEYLIHLQNVIFLFFSLNFESYLWLYWYGFSLHCLDLIASRWDPGKGKQNRYCFFITLPHVANCAQKCVHTEVRHFCFFFNLHL